MKEVEQILKKYSAQIRDADKEHIRYLAKTTDNFHVVSHTFDPRKGRNGVVEIVFEYGMNLGSYELLINA